MTDNLSTGDAAARERVHVEYANNGTWIPTTQEIQTFHETQVALHGYVEQVACEIAMTRLQAAGQPIDARPWMKTITGPSIDLLYYPTRYDRSECRTSRIRVSMADVLPEFAQYQAVVNALSL